MRLYERSVFWSRLIVNVLEAFAKFFGQQFLELDQKAQNDTHV